MRVLELTGADARDHRLESKILQGKAKGDLTQYPVMKQLVNHIQLGLSMNTTLERVELDFPPWLSGCIKRELMWCHGHMIIFLFYVLASQLLSVSVSLSVQLQVFYATTVILFLSYLEILLGTVKVTAGQCIFVPLVRVCNSLNSKFHP